MSVHGCSETFEGSQLVGMDSEDQKMTCFPVFEAWITVKVGWRGYRKNQDERGSNRKPPEI